MPVTRAEALAILEEGHRAVAEILASIPDGEMEHLGTVGDGDWSAKDLAVHLAGCEADAIEAIAAWRRGERPPGLDRSDDEVDRRNADEVAHHRSHRPSGARARFEGVYGDLIAAIDAIGDAEWAAPIAGDGSVTLGDAVGDELGGGSGPFRHAEDHLGGLRRYAASLRTKA